MAFEVAQGSRREYAVDGRSAGSGETEAAREGLRELSSLGSGSANGVQTASGGGCGQRRVIMIHQRAWPCCLRYHRGNTTPASPSPTTCSCSAHSCCIDIKLPGSQRLHASLHSRQDCRRAVMACTCRCCDDVHPSARGVINAEQPDHKTARIPAIARQPSQSTGLSTCCDGLHVSVL